MIQADNNKKQLKILIYGFGRMGLTHFSILNALNSDFCFTIIETNKTLKKILQKNIRANFYSNDSELKEAFDITLITTPPFIHSSILNSSLQRGDKKIFIEKPFGGHKNLTTPKNIKKTPIYIGYVLRHNSCIQWLKKNIKNGDVKSIKAQYVSNTIEKKPKGWRNSSFSGVLNEMGSHIIDLIQYILGNEKMILKSSKIESVISDVDDIVEAKLKTINHKNISIYVNWVKKEIRKPVFHLEIETKKGIKYIVDQQQIKILNQKNETTKKISPTDLITPVPYYLRGVDFTNQMLDLIGETNKTATVNEALEVNKIMNEILKNENNTRR